jgi:hypothetical protein
MAASPISRIMSMRQMPPGRGSSVAPLPIQRTIFIESVK